MDTPSPSQKYRLIVFDLGGVLVRICRSWQDAAKAAGVDISLPSDIFTPVAALGEFDTYQEASLELDGYLEALANFTGCNPGEALRLHNGILQEPYPETEEVIEEIEAAGYETGCLSNTNDAHWQDLIDGRRFPAIARLQRKMASHLVGLNKPDPRIFERYAEEHGVRPDQVVFFDDDGRNVASARSVGFEAFQIDPSSSTARQIRERLVHLGVL